MNIKLKKLEANAQVPTRVTPGSAGLDLYVSKKTSIPTGETVLLETGWAIEIPKGFFGLVKIKSGAAVNLKITENAGVIDCDYRGPLKTAISNISNSPVTLLRGDSVAQLLILPYESVGVEIVDELSPTTRGEKGFGQASQSA